jgi:plasmid maintenance system antidote protein VapI
MPRYLLNVRALKEVAAEDGDTRQRDIAERSGVHETVVSRLINGRELSLDALMRLSVTYRVSANKLTVIVEDFDQKAAA